VVANPDTAALCMLNTFKGLKSVLLKGGHDTTRKGVCADHLYILLGEVLTLLTTVTIVILSTWSVLAQLSPPFPLSLLSPLSPL
jgi:hypothetical protein